MQQATALAAKQVVPLFSTTNLAATKAFYEQALGMRAYFDAPCFLGLRLPDNPSVEISFVDPTQSQGAVSSPAGLTFVLVVDDVDAEHARLWDASIEVESPPEDMPWGDRRMVLRDPNGIALYIRSGIAVTAEFQPYVREL